MIPFLKLLDEVVKPQKKPQEKLVEGTKAFGEGIKEAVDKFNPFKDLSKFNPFRKK
jgi:hypothetical protein